MAGAAKWMGGALCALVITGAMASSAGARTEMPDAAPQGMTAIAIHGGAGSIQRGSLSPELEAQYTAALEQALRAGHEILEAGGSSLDAVVAAVRVMEDSPLFNAGRGAVYTAQGTVELDAAVMDGRTRAAGAVAGVQRVKNPVVLARAVMEHSPHVMLIGAGAEAFAAEHGIELVDPSYFFTQRRWEAFERFMARQTGGARTASSADIAAGMPGGDSTREQRGDFEGGLGTVGAVALDRNGDLAAATSTGGTPNKRYGRVGDSPIIGAGTYADADCAVSATGHGEHFIRRVVAYDICARVRYAGATLTDAARTVVLEELAQAGAEGGVIAIDRNGNIVMPFNSAGMFRGSIDAAGTLTTAMYGD